MAMDLEREFFDRVKSCANSPQRSCSLMQLEEDLGKLKTTMLNMQDIINRVEWHSHNEAAAELLPCIKDAMYNGEDLLDEFHYYALKAKVEVDSHMSLQNHGTFEEFFNRVNTGDYIDKIKRIQENIDNICATSMELGLQETPIMFDKSSRPKVCDGPQKIDREEELKVLLQLLVASVGHKRARTTTNRPNDELLAVLPIVGMWGVGKTSMVQEICNDEEVEEHFDLIIRIRVLHEFNIMRLSKDILVHLDGDASADDLTVLSRNLASCSESKKFLIILDDLCDDILKEDDTKWKDFYAHFKTLLRGSVILVTTRSFEVASLVGTMPHYELMGLRDDVLRGFFLKCAFGSSNSSGDYPELEHIGNDILPKLKGSSLAVKTLGQMLRMNLTKEHWANVLESELWQLEEKETGIPPCLRLTYMSLPQDLKRCFSICALFPKYHKFEKELLIDLWVAQGYVKPQDASACFDDLVNWSFLQKATAQSAEKYIIDGIIHDLVRLVTKDECFVIKRASDLDKIPPYVRHLSIFSKENVGCSELMRISNKGKLRSLICNESYSSPKDFAPVIGCWFKECPRVRVLSFKLSKVTELPKSMGNAKHLRYLKLIGACNFLTLPSSVGRLYHLQALDAHDCRFERLPDGFSRLISLHKLKLRGFTSIKDNSSKLCLKWSWESARTSSYQQGWIMQQQMEELPHWDLQQLEIENYSGKYYPSWLRYESLGMLSSLKFERCLNIDSLSFFKPPYHDSEGPVPYYLDELVINNCEKVNWQSLALLSFVRKIFIDNCHFYSTCMPLQLQSEALQRLEEFYCNHNPFTSINVSGARASSSNSNIGAFSHLAKVTISFCHELQTLDGFLTPAYLPNVKEISVVHCGKLTSLLIDSFHGFSVLEKLVIRDCLKLNTSQKVLTLPSSIKELWLVRCSNIESISCSSPLSASGSLPMLEQVHIDGCPDITSIIGAIPVAQLDSLQKVEIWDCPKLKEIGVPFRRWRF